MVYLKIYIKLIHFMIEIQEIEPRMFIVLFNLGYRFRLLVFNIRISITELSDLARTEILFVLQNRLRNRGLLFFLKHKLLTCHDTPGFLLHFFIDPFFQLLVLLNSLLVLLFRTFFVSQLVEEVVDYLLFLY